MDVPCIDLLPYQRDAVFCGARFTWNCWARQTGKSFTFTLRRLVRALTRHRTQIILSASDIFLDEFAMHGGFSVIEPFLGE
jgi:hypothetical protein